MPTKAKRAKALWVGLMDGEIHFYRLGEYYGGVLHADLFRTRKEAKLCYQEVRKLTRREAGNGSRGR